MVRLSGERRRREQFAYPVYCWKTDSLEKGESRLPTRVFISYAWEDESYKLRVKAFATRLREDGIDARLDLWHTGEGRTLPEFMNSEVRNADKILVLCSPAYRRKVHLMEDRENISGVGWEMALLTSRIWANVDSGGKGIPVLFQGEWAEAAPDYLLAMPRVDLSDEATFEENYIELLRRITGKTETAPTLGKLPDGLDPNPVPPLRGPAPSGTPATASPRTASPTPTNLHAALCAAFTDFDDLRVTLSLALNDNLSSIAANQSLASSGR